MDEFTIPIDVILRAFVNERLDAADDERRRNLLDLAWIPLDADPRAQWVKLLLELTDSLLDDGLVDCDDEALDALDALHFAARTPAKKQQASPPRQTASPPQKSSETAKKDAAFQEWANEMLGDRSPYRGMRGRPSRRPGVDPSAGAL